MLHRIYKIFMIYMIYLAHPENLVNPVYKYLGNQYPTACPSLRRGSVAPNLIPVFSSIMIPSASPR